MSLKKNLLKNGLASAIQKVIKIAEQLLLVPFFITAWGAAYYGEWLTLTIIPTVMALSDFGFGSAAGNSFVLKYASNDKQGAADTATSGFFLIAIMVVFSISISIILLFILNYFHIFDKSLISKNDAMLAVLFLMTARILNFHLQLNEAYYRSARKASLSINLLSLYSALNLGIGLIVLLYKGGVVIYAFTNLINAIVFTLYYTIIARRILPLSESFKGYIRRSEIKSIIKKGFGFLMIPIWQAVFFQGSTFVVRIVLGPIAVTIFNTARTLTRTISQANFMVISSIVPELQFEIGSGNLNQARKIFRFGFINVLFVSIIGFFMLYFFGPWFYQIWTHKSIILPIGMWNIFIIGILFNGIWSMSSEILISANKPYDFVFAGIIVSIISVISSYFLLLQYGLLGAAIGSLLLDIILIIYTLPRSCKLINQPLVGLLSNSYLELKYLVLRQISNKNRRN